MDKHANAAAGPSQPLQRPILSYAPSAATARPPTNGPPSRPEWVAAGFNPSAPYPQPAAASSTSYTGPPAAGRPVIPVKRGRGRPPGVRNHTNGSPFYPTSNAASSKTPSMSPAPPPPLPKFDIAEWVTPELIQASKEFAASVAAPDAPGFDPNKPLVCGTCGLGFPRVPFFKRDRQPSGKYVSARVQVLLGHDADDGVTVVAGVHVLQKTQYGSQAGRSRKQGNSALLPCRRLRVFAL
jgi:hypothetical protein